jgi:hypothetical protein
MMMSLLCLMLLGEENISCIKGQFLSLCGIIGSCGIT